MKNIFLPVYLLLGVAVIVPPAWGTPAANNVFSPDAKSTSPRAAQNAQIVKVVSRFVQQQTAVLPGKLNYQVNEIDRRLTLSACSKIEAYLPSGSQLIGKTSVGVRCNDAGGWHIFVPVHIRVSQDFVVSARQLPLGHTLQAQDLTSMTTETSQASGLTDPEQAIGKVLRYGIVAGQVIRENMLRQPFSVTQGQIVQLLAQGSGFSVNSAGAALDNASEGQAVRVRVGSNRVIGGFARGYGLVEIAP